MNYNQLIRDERLMAVYVTYETELCKNAKCENAKRTRSGLSWAQ